VTVKTSGLWGVLVTKVPPATQRAALRQLIAVKDASVAAAGAGIRKVRQLVVRANEMRGVAPGAVPLDVAEIVHAAAASASPQASAAARTARSFARRRPISQLTRT
jgi:hypothetical protein